jgi:L-aminopeptidase/D-esterase-like protein
LAFSTMPRAEAQVGDTEMAAKSISEFFRACIESVEEAIVNSLLRARTVVGRDDNAAYAIPIDAVADLLMKHR